MLLKPCFIFLFLIFTVESNVDTVLVTLTTRCTRRGDVTSSQNKPMDQQIPKIQRTQLLGERS